MKLKRKRRTKFQNAQLQTAEERVASILFIKKRTQRSAIQKEFAKMVQLRKSIASLLGDIMADTYVEILEPESKNIPSGMSGSDCVDWCNNDSLRWSKDLIAQMPSEKVGRFVQTGDDSAFYTFTEGSKKKGVWNHSLSRTMTKHEIINFRFNRLPGTGIERPAKADRIISRIMREDHRIVREFSIVTGMLTSKQTTVADTWTEKSKLNKTVTSAGAKTAATTAAMVGGGAALLGGLFAALGSAAASAGPALVAVADPAITIGSLALFGWE